MTVDPRAIDPRGANPLAIDPRGADPCGVARRALARVHVALMASDDRGDVPGWVLVSVMSAGLVTALWVIADDQLSAVLGRAIGSVTAP